MELLSVIFLPFMAVMTINLISDALSVCRLFKKILN